MVDTKHTEQMPNRSFHIQDIECISNIKKYREVKWEEYDQHRREEYEENNEL